MEKENLQVRDKDTMKMFKKKNSNMIHKKAFSENNSENVEDNLKVFLAHFNSENNKKLLNNNKVQSEKEIEDLPIKDNFNNSFSGTTLSSLSHNESENEDFSMKNSNVLNLRPNYILKPCFRNGENGINESDNKINISPSIYDYYS